MKLPRTTLTFLIILSCVLHGRAALPGQKDIYISQNGGGTVQVLAWLNNGANWGRGTNQINPGDTIHITGAITNTILLLGSGIAGGNPTTLYFESNAMCSAPTLNTPGQSEWIYAGGLHDVVIDGGVNGILQCTSNGTSAAYGGNCPFSIGDLMGIFGNLNSNLIVQNLTISNLYNRLPSSSDPEQGSSVNSTAINLNIGTNILIRNNVFYNNEQAIMFVPSFCSNLTIIGNSIIGFNHGITIGFGQSSINPWFYNAIIRSNIIVEADSYESTNVSVGANWHRDPVFIFDNAWSSTGPTIEDPTNYYYGLFSNIDISFNWFGSGINPQTTTAGSAALYVENHSTNSITAIRIYNNVFTLQMPLEWGDNFLGSGFDMGTNNFVANNTLISWHTNINGGGVYYPHQIPIAVGQNCMVMNNLMVDGTPGLAEFGQPVTNVLGGFGGGTQQYVVGSFYSGFNVYASGAAPLLDQGAYAGFGAGGQVANFTGWFPSIAQWKALGPNYDNTSIVTNAVTLTASYQLTPGSAGIGAGTNLSAFFTNDICGNARATNGAWDVGAVVSAANPLPLLTQVIGYSATNIAKGAAAAPIVLSAPANLRIVTSNQLAQMALSSALLAWYTFDEGSGNTANDSSGNGVNITFVGNGWGPGQITNAIEGFNTSMTSSINNPPTLGTNWTISFWMWPDSTSTGSLGSIWAAPSAGIWYRHDVKHLDFSFNGADHFNSTVYTENQWLFLSVVNNAGSVTFYLNGAADGTASGGVGFQAFAVLGNSSGLNFKGYLDDLRVYNIALTTAQVAAQYQYPN